jgi:hypothetical protein
MASTRVRLKALVGVWLCVALVSQALASEVGPSGYTSVQLAAFGAKLQDVVRSESPERVSGLIVFPLRVNDSKGHSRSLSKSAFLSQYQSVFTPEVKAAVLTQELQSIFQSSRGAMFGDGAVWASGVPGIEIARRSPWV